MVDPYGNTITVSEISVDNSVKAATNNVNFTTTEITNSPVTGKHFVNDLNKAAVLPQTGETDNSEITAIGLLMMSIAGIFGLEIQRKKKY
ncbi:LPXTG cell wall anchor domain-containing protein [Liquorilactobacillus sp.]|uniref:LPXTG cell wall anchor domain-containing protein n=1 Tax=Liquorilactobacillus sp. TaxID=2767923 RepID=UPI0039E75A7D